MRVELVDLIEDTIALEAPPKQAAKWWLYVSRKIKAKQATA